MRTDGHDEANCSFSHFLRTRLKMAAVINEIALSHCS